MGHVKDWSRNSKKYRPRDQRRNLLEFMHILPKLELKPLQDITRRYRPDPRSLPQDQPKCIADWCWYIYGAGIRNAFGLRSGAIARLVEANDEGMSPKKMQYLVTLEYISEDYLKRKTKREARNALG